MKSESAQQSSLGTRTSRVVSDALKSGYRRATGQNSSSAKDWFQAIKEVEGGNDLVASVDSSPCTEEKAQEAQSPGLFQAAKARFKSFFKNNETAPIAQKKAEEEKPSTLLPQKKEADSPSPNQSELAQAKKQAGPAISEAEDKELEKLFRELLFLESEIPDAKAEKVTQQQILSRAPQVNENPSLMTHGNALSIAFTNLDNALKQLKDNKDLLKNNSDTDSLIVTAMSYIICIENVILFKQSAEFTNDSVFNTYELLIKDTYKKLDDFMEYINSNKSDNYKIGASSQKEFSQTLFSLAQRYVSKSSVNLLKRFILAHNLEDSITNVVKNNNLSPFQMSLIKLNLPLLQMFIEVNERVFINIIEQGMLYPIHFIKAHLKKLEIVINRKLDSLIDKRNKQLLIHELKKLLIQAIVAQDKLENPHELSKKELEELNTEMSILNHFSSSVETIKKLQNDEKSIFQILDAWGTYDFLDGTAYDFLTNLIIFDKASDIEMENFNNYAEAYKIFKENAKKLNPANYPKAPTQLAFEMIEHL